jgi:hypothetical protein
MAEGYRNPSLSSTPEATTKVQKKEGKIEGEKVRRTCSAAESRLI